MQLTGLKAAGRDLDPAVGWADETRDATLRCTGILKFFRCSAVLDEAMSIGLWVLDELAVVRS